MKPSPAVAGQVEQPPPSSSIEPASPPGPAAAIAGIMSNRSAPPPVAEPSTTSTIDRSSHQRSQYTPEDSDEDSPRPSLPRRPPSQQLSPPPTQYASPRSPDSDGGVAPSPPYNRAINQDRSEDRGHPSPGGFHLYNINEMVSAIGKKKKLPTTLGLNLATGMVMIAPEKSRDGPQQEWSAEKLTHYSIEGKHVFMELVRPSKSVDFHAGAKDTAQEIVAGLGEIAGAARAEGLREVLEIGAGGNSQKKGSILYDFMAQGDDEVTVGIGDDVVVLDDTKSEEWWMVRRLKNGKEGVVPSSYVEITGTTAPTSTTGINAGKSTVEQNRLEEERLAKEALKRTRREEEKETKGSEVGPGVKLPKRGSSLASNGDRESSQKSKRSSKDGKSSSSSKSSKCYPAAFFERHLKCRQSLMRIKSEPGPIDLAPSKSKPNSSDSRMVKSISTRSTELKLRYLWPRWPFKIWSTSRPSQGYLWMTRNLCRIFDGKALSHPKEVIGGNNSHSPLPNPVQL